MIIALSGRKQSGKSILAELAEKKGFVRISFASPLKEIACIMLGFQNFEELNSSKDKNVNFLFDEKNVEILQKLTNLNSSEIKNLTLSKKCDTVRDFLQFVGSDVIRKIDPNWHIKKASLKIKNGCNYIFDDLRFKNEKDFLTEKGALMFFVMRPRQFDYSNHESETSLKWIDFDDYIVNNDKSFFRLKKRFNAFLRVMCGSGITTSKKINSILNIKDKLEFRKWFKFNLYEKGSEYIQETLGWSKDSVNIWAYNMLLHRGKNIYNYNREAFLNADKETSYLAGVLTADGCVKDVSTNNNITLSLGMMDFEPIERLRNLYKTERPITNKIHKISKKIIYEIDTNDPFILENIKLWNIKPRKSEKEEVPHLIKEDLQNMKAWIVGLIDGDGSICFGTPNNKKWPNLKPSIRLQILTSKEICECLTNLIPVHHVVRPHKKTKLFEMSFSNFYALDFYNWLDRPDFGLKRKWSKLEEFKNFNTSRRTPKGEFSD